MGTGKRVDYGLDEKNDFLRQLIAMRHFDRAALDITKQVIDKGKDALSEKQKFLFKQ